MDTESNTRVKYEEALSIRVGKFISAMGFNLANSEGEAIAHLEDVNSLGILYKDPSAKPKRIMFGLIKQEHPRIFLGKIRINKPEWTFDAYGQEHAAIVKEIAEELSKAFDVDVSIKLRSEQSLHESFFLCSELF